MHKILVVDDDIQMLGLISQLLEREGYEVITASSTHQLLRLIEHNVPDLFLIDASLPVIDGLALCRQLRKNPKVSSLPVVFITGHDSRYTVADALEAGGDDYIRKPFAVRELTARLRAHLRRTAKAEIADELPTIEIFADTRTVLVDKRLVDLTQVEFELLTYLCAAPSRMHSTQDLLIHVWQYPPNTGDTALVRNHIRNLRRKLEDSPERPAIIQSRHGRGYTIKAQIQYLKEAYYQSA